MGIKTEKRRKEIRQRFRGLRSQTLKGTPMLSLVDSQIVIPPVLQRFLGCIILGEVPTEVGEAIDNIEEQQVPESILFLMKIWWGRNHAEKALPDVVELLQDAVKDMLS